MSDRVIVSVQDGVADVRLNRPDKLNALDVPMFQALVEAGRAVARDRSVRAVVLSGEGRAFCAGLDMGSFQAMAGAGSGGGPSLLSREGADSPANFAQLAAWVWTEVPVPVPTLKTRWPAGPSARWSSASMCAPARSSTCT